MRQNRGEPLCPHCGSPDLTFKHVFGYYKCNACSITFLTPVFSYGQGSGAGLDSAKDVASMIFGERSAPRTENRIPEPPPVVEDTPPARQRPVRQPPPQRQNYAEQKLVRQTQAGPRPLNNGKAKGQRKPSVLVPVLLVIIILQALAIIWLLFGDQLIDLFNGLV